MWALPCGRGEGARAPRPHPALQTCTGPQGRARRRESGSEAGAPGTQGLQAPRGMLWGPHGNGVPAPEGRIPHGFSTNQGVPVPSREGRARPGHGATLPQGPQGQRCSAFLHPESRGQRPGEAPKDERGKNCSSADRGPRN